jgi:hypothetical protein
MPPVFRWGIKPNVVDLSFIVRHSRVGRHFLAGFNLTFVMKEVIVNIQ